MSRRAVFLDRDGTLIPETGARATDPAVEPLPHASDAIKRLRKAGFLIVVVTNQSGIARGYYTEADLAATHEALLGKFAAAGAPIDALYYCPHLPDGVVEQYAVECECRKPRPGMLLRAAVDFDIDLARWSYMIGDASRDIEAAKAAGCKGAALVLPGDADDTPQGWPGGADAVTSDVLGAAVWIVEEEGLLDG